MNFSDISKVPNDKIGHTTSIFPKKNMSYERQRRRSRSRDSLEKDYINFPLMLVILQEHLPLINSEFVKQLQRSSGIEEIYLKTQFDISEFRDGILYIREGSTPEKFSALDMVK